MSIAAAIDIDTTQAWTEQQIHAGSDRNIHAMVFEADRPKSVVIVAGAMGVTQDKYKKFARFLQEQGHTVITFDYFGTGKSLHTHLKDCKTDVRSWGEQDCEAILNFAQQRYPSLPIQWIGHSVGGQLLGIMRNSNQLSQAITVASGTGYWRYNAPKTRRSILFMWYVVAPVMLSVFGYFPGRKLKIVGDMPAKVMWQWRRWCLVEGYAAEVEGADIKNRYAEVTIPITSISFADDEMLSEKSIQGLNQQFQQSKLSVVRLNPKDIGETFIGHLGWNREKFKDSIWRNEILVRLND